MSSKTLNGPCCVLADHGFFMLRRTLEPWNKSSIARIADHDTKISQPAGVFRPLDRRVRKDLAKGGLAYRSQGVKRRVKEPGFLPGKRC